MLDASAAVPLLIDQAQSESARAALLKQVDAVATGHVPELFYLEVGNALASQVRVGNLKLGGARELTDTVYSWETVHTPDWQLSDPAIQLALKQSCTVYDACYLVLAQSLKATLITADRQLASVAQKIGVTVDFLAPN